MAAGRACALVALACVLGACRGEATAQAVLESAGSHVQETGRPRENMSTAVSVVVEPVPDSPEIMALERLHRTIDRNNDGVIDGREHPETEEREDDFKALSLDNLKVLWQLNKVRYWNTFELCQWLRRVDLEAIVPAVAAAQLNGSHLPLLAAKSSATYRTLGIADRFLKQKLYLRAYDLVVFGDSTERDYTMHIIVALVILVLAYKVLRYRTETMSQELYSLEARPIETWSASDVEQWLICNHLQKYYRVFRCHGVTGPMLLRLNPTMLASMGVLDDREQRLIISRLRRFTHGSVSEEGEREFHNNDSLFVCVDCKLQKVAWVEVHLFEAIACGQFGEVRRGLWRLPDAPDVPELVAWKKILHIDKPSSMQHFRREVQMLSRCKHPNIVLLLGASLDESNPFVCTELADGGTLYAFLHNSTEKLSLSWVLGKAEEICAGMVYLSNLHIIHRDLKSLNILLASVPGRTQKIAKICDFGLSRVLDHATMVTGSSGTAGWMAPEIIKHEITSETCDVFSYGIVLWEMMTRQIPWQGMTAVQVIFAVGNHGRRPPIPADSPQLFAELITRCWAQERTARPSFEEIAALLDKERDQFLAVMTNDSDALLASQNTWRQEIREDIKSIKADLPHEGLEDI
eukprot:m.75505 g.75505  ORF g.75505 m.75505 type:complete len:634 (+) comp7820_c0_seq1:67-1968(+)